MANKLIHKRSSVVTDNMPKLPQADGLEFGEIAINYADGFETVSFKNSENEIVEIRTKEYFENIINENEEVVSSALNDLNTRVNDVEDAYAAGDNALKVYVEGLIDGLDIEIPTKLSEFTNDVPFVTQGEFNSVYNAINDKQDKITDLETIRNGAALGATALQSVPSEYVTENELTAKGYLTSVPSEYVTLEAVKLMIKEATKRIDGGVINTENTPTVNTIGEITENNDILINEEMLSAGAYTLKYLDSNDNVVDNIKPISNFTI